MLKIAFLVTFCGLLARMAQAQTPVPCNEYPVILSGSNLFQKPITETVPQNYITPEFPGPVTDPGTGYQYTNLKPTTTPSKSCTVGTEKGGRLTVSLKGTSGYTGQVTDSRTTTNVGSTVTTRVYTDLFMQINSKGEIECTAPNMDRVHTFCKSEPALGGIIGGLIQTVLNVISLLLGALDKLIQGIINNTVPDLVAALLNTVNAILKTLTESKQMGAGMSCNHEMKDVTTDTSGNIIMTCTSIMYSSSGMPIPPPSDAYIPTAFQPETGSACSFLLPEGLINHALTYFTNTVFELTASALDALSKEISAVCGTATTVVKLLVTATGPYRVEITKDKFSATLLVRVELFVTENTSPIIAFSATFGYDATFSYKKPCVMLHLSFTSLSNFKYVGENPSCDVSLQLSKALSIWLQANPPSEMCVAASPGANLPIAGSTKITPGDDCLIVNHSK